MAFNGRYTHAFSKTLVHASILTALGSMAPAQAFEFSLADGEVKGSFDTTLSYGVLMRADKRDPTTVGIINGGAFPGPNNAGSFAGVNSDDGNRTYDRGDVVSSLFKMTNDLELSYRNYGFFARTLAFYDTAITGKQTFANGAGLSQEAEKRLADDARILDFYVRGSFDLAGKNLNARLGRQVVNWGESTFIPNGINVINPVDVARLRAPGSEIKEGLLPQEMLWASQELTDNVSVEAFYQFKWRETRIDPRGSFFSTNDAVSPGSTNVFAGFGLRPDSLTASLCGPTPATNVGCSQFFRREGNLDAKDSGQFGVAGRILLPQLDNAELGLYFIQYHSRTPFINTVRGGVNTFQPTSAMPPAGSPAAQSPIVVQSGVAANTTTGASCATATNPGCTGTAANPLAARYRTVFPEDINLFGLSLSGSGPLGISLQGEYSYRPNQPLQLAQTELLLASLGAANGIGVPSIPEIGASGDSTLGIGRTIQGYREVKMHQAQMTATKSFGPQFGSSQLTSVGEIGVTYLDLPDGILFEAPGTALPFVGANPTLNASGVGSNGYVTKRSWGYRLLNRADYPNAIGAWTVSPRLAFSHDVRGAGPTFNQGVQSINIGITGNLRNQWVADLSYTGFFGGRTYSGAALASGGLTSSSSANPLKDRDFIAATVSYSF